MKQHKRSSGGVGGSPVKNTTNSMQIQPGGGSVKAMKNSVSLRNVGGSGGPKKIKGAVSG